MAFLSSLFSTTPIHEFRRFIISLLVLTSNRSLYNLFFYYLFLHSPFCSLLLLPIILILFFSSFPPMFYLSSLFLLPSDFYIHTCIQSFQPQMSDLYNIFPLITVWKSMILLLKSFLKFLSPIPFFYLPWRKSSYTPLIDKPVIVPNSYRLKSTQLGLQNDLPHHDGRSLHSHPGPNPTSRTKSSPKPQKHLSSTNQNLTLT